MTVPLSFRRNSATPKIIIIHHKYLDQDGIISMDGYFVTTPYQTLLDVITEAPISHDLILQAVKAASNRGVVTQTMAKQLLNEKSVQAIYHLLKSSLRSARKRGRFQKEFGNEIAQTSSIHRNCIRKQVAFERFLARLFKQEHSPWILKGGHAMELRLRIARSTQDIDLFVKTHVLIEDQRAEDGNIDFSDFFEYRISFPEVALTGPPYGGFGPGGDPGLRIAHLKNFI